jgi:hypothetical protein
MILIEDSIIILPPLVCLANHTLPPPATNTTRIKYHTPQATGHTHVIAKKRGGVRVQEAERERRR